MTTPNDESEEMRHANQSQGPDAEDGLGKGSNPNNVSNDASPTREAHSAEEPTEGQYSDSLKPDKIGSTGAPRLDYPAELTSGFDAQKEDVQTAAGAPQNSGDEIRPESRDEGLSRGRGAEDYDQYGSGVVEGNGAPAADHTAKEVVNLFVRNVAKHVMEPQLVDLFSKYGNVDSAVVVRDPHSKECRGFGFVKMCTEEGAKEAMAALQDFDFEGRKISVERAKRTEPHSRTPGAYMGIDRRIRDRYAGMKRHREYDIPRYPPYPPQYDMRGSGYRGRSYDPTRGRPDGRQWGYRMPYDNQTSDDRDRLRRRYNADGPRYPPPREFERDQRYREREAPVPRESADDYI